MNRSASRSHNNVWRTLNVCCSPALILLSLSSFICFWLDNSSHLQSGARRSGSNAPSIPELVHGPERIVTTPSPALQQPPAPLVTQKQTPVRTTPAPESSDDEDVVLAVRGGLLIPDLDKVEVKLKPKPKEEEKKKLALPAGEFKSEELETERGSEHIDENNIQFKAEWHGAQLLVHTLLATKLTLKKDDVSWVTQLTADRLEGFTKMMERWKGPITAALYCRDLKKDLAAIKPLRDRVDFHLILADLHPGRLYPVNTLRNVAIDNCRTQYIALVDADFVPNDGLYESLLPKIPTWKDGENAVYVLAAFQLQSGKVVPRTKPELLEMWGKGQLSPVHPEPGRDIAHKHTDYPRWKIASEVYEARYQLPYEPYFVADKQRMPRYDASFLGYGNDKTGHCYEIFKAGIKYLVLPDAFVFHQDHPRGEWLSSDIEFSLRNPTTLGSFFLEMESKYPATAKPRQITPVAGRKGENCTITCKRANMACHSGYHKDVNKCDVLKRLFGAEKCGPTCADNMFGNDLPAYNHAFKQCLINQKPTEYKINCQQAQVDSERVCPCGEVVPEWLTHDWITKQGLYDYKKNK